MNILYIKLGDLAHLWSTLSYLLGFDIVKAQFIEV